MPFEHLWIDNILMFAPDDEPFSLSEHLKKCSVTFNNKEMEYSVPQMFKILKNEKLIKLIEGHGYGVIIQLTDYGVEAKKHRPYAQWQKEIHLEKKRDKEIKELKYKKLKRDANSDLQIVYAERSLSFINAEFKKQSIPHAGKYYIHKHMVSADFPIFEITNFKSTVYKLVADSKNVDEIKRILHHLFIIARKNVKIYRKRILPIWNSVYGTNVPENKRNTYNRLMVVKSNTFGIKVSVQTSKSITGHLDKNHIFDNLPQKEYHNEELYHYSLEIYEFLKGVTYNGLVGTYRKLMNWCLKHAWQLIIGITGSLIASYLVLHYKLFVSK